MIGDYSLIYLGQLYESVNGTVLIISKMYSSIYQAALS
jgi:hypothetical protein